MLTGRGRFSSTPASPPPLSVPVFLLRARSICVHFIRKSEGRTGKMSTSGLKAIAHVPKASDFLDIVLSKTQRKTPTVRFRLLKCGK